MISFMETPHPCPSPKKERGKSKKYTPPLCWRGGLGGEEIISIVGEGVGG
jgi:hypothetical protein